MKEVAMPVSKLLEKNEIIKKVWEEYITTESLDHEQLRGIIADSWIRSKNHGIDPLAFKISMEIEQTKIEVFQRDYIEIVQRAKPFMEAIYQTVGDDGMFVRLTNAEGYVIDCIGDEEVFNSDVGQFFFKGKNVKEEVIGTNAIGLALKKKVPIQVLGAEHYRKSYHELTTSASPIRDESGEVVAVLSITGDYRRVHPHTLGLVMASALAIEHEISLSNMNQDLQRINEHHEAIMKSIKEGIITVDSKGIITGVNLFARKFLNIKNDAIMGMHIGRYVKDEKIDYILSNEIGIEELEIQFMRESGIKKYVIVNTTPIFGNNESIEEHLITFRESKKVYSQVNKIFGSKAIYTFEDILGDSAPIQEAVRMAKLVSDSTVTILLNGESGTGKELFAQSIHNASQRRNNSFVFINCGAIPRDLVASELFGYVEGAFTGARKGGTPGKFELSDGGTLFLDEIGDMPLDTQANLLRVLETREVVRVGGHEVIPVDVRVIAASHKDLKKEVERGNFRSDLFYRLNVMPIHTPALRERREDIRLLIDWFYRQFSPGPSEKIRIDANFYKIMRAYHWPGNVRELQNVMQMVCNISDTEEQLTNHHLPAYLKEKLDIEEIQEGTVIKPLYMLEKEMIASALRISEGNLVQTAKLLEIGRSTLYRKIEKYKIEI
jgi:transcriptional regulator of acetoin/glycerol metabolism